MAVEWAGLGPELLITIDRDSAVGLRAQLEDQLRTAIRRGRLAGDERLPSSRELAGALGLSRGLVQDCYAQLQAEGYLVSRPGSATRVAAGAAGRQDTPPRPSRPDRPRHAVADFRHGVPDLRMAPREDWAWAVREVCRTAPNTAFDYGDPLGERRLREVLAAYLRRVRAVDATADHVVVCTGMAQALGLVLRALAADGVDTVAVENPGVVGSTTEQANAAGMAVVPVPVDEDGLDVAALAATPARAVLVTPAHQWPTGVVLAGHRRQELLAWARRHDGVVIEDDYDAEHRYDRPPVPALRSMLADRVFYTGSVSKLLAPALRTGWLLPPPAFMDAVVAEKRFADLGNAALPQLVLAELMASGEMERTLRLLRHRHRRRRDAMIGAVAAHLPGAAVHGAAAGLHLTVTLAPGTDDAALAAAALEEGVKVQPLSWHAQRPGRPGLVLGYAAATASDIAEGIAVLGRTLKRLNA